ncbi:PD-(D/E)XK nuclease-like domain-containing protein [Microvirga alba]|uniref:PD-(D/E)XK nuclease-like domain-containing protein n=1 Tax=Microvirga alba TaxID=2791025 RepID=A0A931FUF1_9HYPH|nr:PD-(D/E)XK nuclease-like domain-containing protein [Microvirga alba]MBF9235551.1 PD-(D/E)XK nuclease-like domain-containing protein [Microvirga alba]
MKPGVYDHLSNAEYHGGPGVNKGLLDIVRRSPLHAKAALDAANDNEPTAAQAIGTAFHSLLLEPEAFAQQYVVAPKFDRRTKDGKAAAEAFQAEHEGKLFIDQEQQDQLLAMAHSVRQHPAANALLTGSPGKAELSVYWTDPITGELCRCRPDFWRQDGIIVDVKTTEDASQEEFSRSLVKWRYHVQAPWYLDGTIIAHQSGHAPKGWSEPKAFAFLVVEKKPPHAVAVYVMDQESMALGRVEYRADLDRLAECRRTNVWPGYGDTIQQIGVPQWYLLRNAAAITAA